VSFDVNEAIAMGALLMLTVTLYVGPVHPNEFVSVTVIEAIPGASPFTVFEFPVVREILVSALILAQV
jgi:hypothetical protein